MGANFVCSFKRFHWLLSLPLRDIDFVFHRVFIISSFSTSLWKIILFWGRSLLPLVFFFLNSLYSYFRQLFMPTGDNTRIDLLSIVNLNKLPPLIQFPHSYNENDNTWHIVVNAWQMMVMTWYYYRKWTSEWSYQQSLIMKSTGHSLHYKEWIGMQCPSVLGFGAIPLIHCLTSEVGRLFTKGHIINILDFADHRSLFQLLDFAVVTGKQLEAVCKWMNVLCSSQTLL